MSTRSTTTEMVASQIQGKALDLRSHIYSVGATLFYLLTGRSLFEKAHPVELVAAILNELEGCRRTDVTLTGLILPFTLFISLFQGVRNEDNPHTFTGPIPFKVVSKQNRKGHLELMGLFRFQILM